MTETRHRWHPVADPPGQLVRPVRLDPAGRTGPTKRQAAGPYWIRTSHGRYVPFDAPRHLPEQRILEQVARGRALVAATGWAACRLWGAAFFDGLARDGRSPLRVPLNVGPLGELASSTASFPLHHVLLPDDRATRYGIATVSPDRAAYDAMRLARTDRERLVVADMVAAAGMCSLETMRDYAREQPQHATRILATLELASEHSRSPRETELRDIAERDANLPPLLVNPSIYDRSGRFIAEVDLFDVRAGQSLELDGADHRDARRQAGDLERTRSLSAVGIEECRVVGFETSVPHVVVRRIHQSRSRALFLPDSERQWVVVPRRDVLHDRVVVRRLRERERSA